MWSSKDGGAPPYARTSLLATPPSGDTPQRPGQVTFGGLILDTKELYREILNEHNLNPIHKQNMENPSFCLEGVNPSCGDQITLQLKMDGDKIVDASFIGSGCAVSQASADMMADLVIGKTKEEALHLADIFDRMIKGSVTDEELEALDEAAALQDISHMPARVKCAMLGWRTVKQMLATPDAPAGGAPSPAPSIETK